LRRRRHGKQFSLPKIDYDALLETRRQNIEAVQKSVLAFSDDGRALLTRQQEIFTDAMRQSRDLIAEFKPGGSPQEIAASKPNLHGARSTRWSRTPGTLPSWCRSRATTLRPSS
jgi:hypothetical protein